MKPIKMALALTCALAVLTYTASAAEGEKTCCQKASAESKECSRHCCKDAHKAGKSCEKCNPNKEDLKKEGEKK